MPPTADPAAPTAVGATRFLAFGDSITFGVESAVFDVLFYPSEPPPSAYPRQLQTALTANHAPQAFTVINAGWPGEGAVEGAARIGSLLATYTPAERPQALLLLEGINDLNINRSVNQTVNALRNILDQARIHNVPVLIATMFQTVEVDTPSGQRTNAASLVPALNSGIRSIAAGRQNVFVVDLYAEFGTAGSFLGQDGLHPTPAGYAKMAETFARAIKDAFPVRGTFQ